MARLVESTLGERVGSGRVAEVFAFVPGRVIKLLREPGGIEWLRREAAAQMAAHSAGIRVPEVSELATIDGREGIVMERITASTA